MKINVTPFHFEELIKKGYSLDLIFLLMLIHNEMDISLMCRGSAKIDSLHQSLTRKGLISETEDKITTMGTELLVFMDTKEERKIVKNKKSTTEFDEWWNAFPGTDTYEHKGRKFSGARSLRAGKDDCRIKFDKILLEGEHTSKDLIEALKYDVLQKKEVSVKTGNNKLSYMQNSLTYLNQRTYEAFIDLIKAGNSIEETDKPTGGIYI